MQSGATGELSGHLQSGEPHESSRPKQPSRYSNPPPLHRPGSVGQATLHQSALFSRLGWDGIQTNPNPVGSLASQNYFINQININSGKRARIKLADSAGKPPSVEPKTTRNSIDMSSFHAKSKAKKKLTQNSLCFNSANQNPSILLQNNISHTSRGILDSGTSFGNVNPAFSSRRKAVSVHKTHLASFGCLMTHNNTSATQQQNHTSGSSIARQNLNRLFSETSRANPIISSGSSKIYQTSSSIQQPMGLNIGSLHRQLQLRINLKPTKEPSQPTSSKGNRESSAGSTLLVAQTGGGRNSSPGAHAQLNKSPAKVLGTSENKLALSLSSTFVMPGLDPKLFSKKAGHTSIESGRFPKQSLTNRSTHQPIGRDSVPQRLQIEKISQMLMRFRVRDTHKVQNASRSGTAADHSAARTARPSEADTTVHRHKSKHSSSKQPGQKKPEQVKDSRDRSANLIYHPGKTKPASSHKKGQLSFDIRHSDCQHSSNKGCKSVTHRARPSSTENKHVDRSRRSSKVSRVHRSADDIRSFLTEKPKKPFPKIVEFAVRSRKGNTNGAPQKPNQDSFLALKNWDGRDGVHFFGVYDGHGSSGHLVSSYIASNLPSAVKEELDSCKSVFDPKEVSAEHLNPKVLHGAYRRIFQQLLNGPIDIAYSGTTAVTCMINSSNLLTANTGDSRALICYTSASGEWHPQPLTKDHKPDIPLEAARILSSGGRIGPCPNSTSRSTGPARVWLQTEDVPGLAMSRAVGDLVACSVGVTWKPEISEYKLTKGDKFLVIASDGLWERMSNEDVAAVVIDAYIRKDVEFAADRLLSEAVDRWTSSKYSEIDDITVLVVFFN